MSTTPEGLPCCPECGATAPSLLGHEVQGVYDGVLFWSCLECGHAWARDFGSWVQLNRESAHAAAMWNGPS